MRDPVIAYVALGANLGEPVEAIRKGLVHLGDLPHTTLTRQSWLYRTSPVGASGPDYINAVAEVATRLTAPELLAQLQRLEQEAGRQRPYRNAPRTLDLDLLLFGTGRIDSATLQVPHPRMYQRAFVLVPLAEVAPQLVSPEQLQAVAGQAVTRVQ